MLLKIILSTIVLAHFVICLEEQVFKKSLSNDSLQKLYEKFEQNSNNPKELNAIHKLSQIFNDIKEFEKQLSKESKNRTKLKSDFVDRKVTDFITEVVLNIAKVVEIRSVKTFHILLLSIDFKILIFIVLDCHQGRYQYCTDMSRLSVNYSNYIQPTVRCGDSGLCFHSDLLCFGFD